MSKRFFLMSTVRKQDFSTVELRSVNVRCFPNSIVRSRAEKKVFVGDEVENCKDLSGLAYRRPFERVSYGSYRKWVV